MSRSKARARLKPRSKYTWRDAPDSVLLSHLPDSHQLDRAESLNPNLRTMDRYLAGEQTAVAIISSWQPDYSAFIVARAAPRDE